MTNPACSSRKFTYLTLLCACTIMLAWAAPTVADMTADLFGYGQPVNDLAAERSDTTDVTDDPVLLFSSSYADFHPLTFSLHTAHLVKQAWTPAPPIHPPVVHL
jgi:hypothetical protein